MVSYRKATAQDAREIRGLIWRVGINPFGLNWRRFLIAVDPQGRLVGCGQIKPHGDGSRELASIAVQPEWQGQGIGREIVQRLLVESAFPVYLTCRAARESFYQQFGFRSVGSEALPPYFRRLNRLAAFFRRISPHLGEMRIMAKIS